MRNLAISLAWLLVGCHSTVASVRTRFATENACPESDVNVTHSGATEYRAAGCGKNAGYVCPHASMSVTDVRSCAVEDGWPARVPADHYRPTLPPPDPRVQMP